MISVLVAENRMFFLRLKRHQGELEVSAEQSPSTFLCSSDGPSSFSVSWLKSRFCMSVCLPGQDTKDRDKEMHMFPVSWSFLVIQSCISSF